MSWGRAKYRPPKIRLPLAGDGIFPPCCTLAYWHRPTFTSGRGGQGAGIDLYRALYDYGADVVLVAHEHNYERFAPQDPNGQLEQERGIRQFVVGTGGAPMRDFRFIQPNSEVRNSETFGVLKMTLHPDSYDWEFIPIEGQTFTDSGSGACVTAPGAPAPPPAAVAVSTAPANTTTTAAAPATSTTVAAPVANTATALPAAGLDYTVQAGDTLSLISARYGLDWRQVAQVNQLANPEIIEVGQVIRLPGVQAAAATTTNQPATANQPAAAVGATTTTTTAVTTTPATTAAATTATTAGGSYTVQAGDTLSSIAARNGLTWQALASANGLTGSDFIRVGQVLTIPGRGATVAPAAATTTTVDPTTTTATTPTTTTTTTTGTTTSAPTTVSTAAAAGTPEVHAVASGETIITIAARYGLNWRQLLQLNGLQENSILQIGQQIRLR